MKLQELLEKHHNKLREGYYYQKVELSYYEGYIDLHCRNSGAIYPEIKPLSRLLFSTPFLSLLEWINTPTDIHLICGDCNMYRDDGVYEQKEKRLSEVEYQKLQLAILTTDKDRVDYLEENTL